jgi:hypothetical protein
MQERLPRRKFEVLLPEKEELELDHHESQCPLYRVRTKAFTRRYLRCHGLMEGKGSVYV